jgi:hypothetical protein
MIEATRGMSPTDVVLAIVNERGHREAASANGCESILQERLTGLDGLVPESAYQSRAAMLNLRVQAITDVVQRMILDETRNQVRDLRIESTCYGVTVTGIVDSYYVKTLVNKASCCLDAGMAFVNNVTVTN